MSEPKSFDALLAEHEERRLNAGTPPPFTLPKRPPLPAFDDLPPSYRTLANLRNHQRVIE